LQFDTSRLAMDAQDFSLRSSMGAAFAVPGICAAHRLISPGDENGLKDEEAPAFAKSVVKVRRASGAARIVARALLAEFGLLNVAVPKSPSGAPIWPQGVVGSLTHDSRVAIAAVGRRRDIAAIGVDVEPAEELPSDLIDVVATPREQAIIGGVRFGGRLLFVAKEAVYKAVYSLDQTFLEHHQVEIDFANRKGLVRNGRLVDLRFCISSHLVVLAFIPAT
jgi:4'-phosphopantetheinyl transferase EntD